MFLAVDLSVELAEEHGEDSAGRLVDDWVEIWDQEKSLKDGQHIFVFGLLVKESFHETHTTAII